MYYNERLIVRDANDNKTEKVPGKQRLDREWEHNPVSSSLLRLIVYKGFWSTTSTANGCILLVSYGNGKLRCKTGVVIACLKSLSVDENEAGGSWGLERWLRS